VLEAVGIDRAVSYAKSLGVGTVPSVPSLALGSGEVTLASLTAAYSAFARGGIVREPIFIKRVENQDGSVIYQSDARPSRAVSETTAFLMATMLADVVDSGTAYRARAMGFKKPAAGKTGTTNDFVDAWFVGFTPKLVAGVWVGFDTPRTIVRNGFGGDLAVPMWTQFMLAATQNDDEAWFQPPRDVVPLEVCRISGDRPGAGCRSAASISRTGAISYKSMVYTEYFVRGTEPERTCAVHAMQYAPYAEPYFARSVFEGVELSLPMRTAPPDPVPAVAPPALPAAPRSDADPATELPPPAPPETPPVP
jgi:penicillin-binding protein 1A